MSAGAKADRARLSPLAFALNRLVPKRGRAPYATLERLVVLAVVRAMSLDDGTGDWTLHARDTAGGDEGTLDAWTLRVYCD